VAGLRAWLQGVPGEPVGVLPAGAAAVRPEPLIAEQQRDLLEIVEDRYSAGSLIITSQVPIDRWYESVGNPTLADAILDRFIHSAHRIELKGESLRKQRVAS
jgi:DNA replication protein DnaC